MAKTRRRNFATPEGFATPKQQKGLAVNRRVVKDTPLKINMEPKNERFGADGFPLQRGDFQVPFAVHLFRV